MREALTPGWAALLTADSQCARWVQVEFPTGAGLPPPHPQQVEGAMIMDLLDKLPGMTDADLGTLLSNADRLARTGTPKQQKAAEAALPAIRAETVRRSDLKPPAKRPVKGAQRVAAAPQDS